MYFDNKKIILLKYIGRNIEDVSKELKISERTIRYRIKDLNEIFLEKQNFLYINKKIIKFDGNIEIIKDILNKQTYIFSTEERIEIITLLLLLNSDGYKSERIVDALDISKSTLKGDLKVVRDIFEEKNIQIISKANRGLFLSGEEIDIRKFLLDRFRKIYIISGEELKISSKVNNIESQILENVVDTSEVPLIINFLKKIIKDLKKKISDEAYQIIFLYILIFLNRIKNNFTISKCSNINFIQSTEDYKVIKNNINVLFEDSDYKICEEEIAKITEFVLGAHTYNFNYSFYENWILIEKLVDNLITDVNSKINIDILNDKTLREGLINHIVPTIYRLKNNIELQESIYSEVLEDYEPLYKIIKNALVGVENFIGKSFSENEVAFFVVHFILSMKRNEQKVSETKKVIIVCGLGYGTSNLVKQEIEELFEVEVVDLVPLNNLSTVNLKNIDFIISTIDIKEKNIKIPIIKVNAFLSKEDILHLLNNGIKNKKNKIDIEEVVGIIEKNADIMNKELLRKELLKYLSNDELLNKSCEKNLIDLLPNENIKIKDKVSTWEEAIDEAGNILLENGYITKEYISEMKNKINQLGMYMVIDNKTLLPHGDISEKVLKTGLSYLQLKKEVIFPQNIPIKHIFALSTTNSEEHIKGLLELKKALEENDLRKKLEKCKTEEEILNIININTR